MIASYYIYYRSSAAEEVRARVRAMQADLEHSAGVTGRLLRRCDDATTWMEIYEHVVDGVAFERALEDALHRHRIADLLLPGARRHVERFADA